MFEKLMKAAERTATGVSRRGFLGRVGQGALVAAGAVGGLLLTAGDVRAGPTTCCQGKPCPAGHICCFTSCRCQKPDQRCGPPL